MTFTEAAIEVLRREGKPLHFKKLTEIAIRESLLDHVGKIPEETMADQLTAHCRLPRPDRRLVPVQQGTFALAEWDLDEDPLALEGLLVPPDEGELTYRSRERHPVPSRDITRTTARSEERRPRRREDEERKGRRFPPPAEVAYEILAGAGRALALSDIAAQGAERLLMPEAFVRDSASLRAALGEDNRRREQTGRKPLFQLDGDEVTLVAQPEPGERAAVAPAVVARPPASATELRRAALAALRRRVRECDGPTAELVATRLLEKLGYRELKVAKRGKEHVIYTARRRMGLADVRHAVRIARAGADVGRRDVTDLRRDLAHYGAQVGVVLSAGEAARDARGEAASAGQLPVFLLCGEALAESLAEAGVGTVPVVVPEIDDAFFKSAAETAELEEVARKARREERDRRDEREPRERREERPQRERREGSRRDEARPADLLVTEAEPSADEPGAERAARGGTPFLEVLAESAPAAELTAAVAAAVAGNEDDEEQFEDAPDDDGEGEAEDPKPGEGAKAGGEAGADADAGRRRRRRRRRRGGRGRAREGGGQAGQRAGSSEAGTPPPAAGQERAGAGGPAPEGTSARAPEVASASAPDGADAPRPEGTNASSEEGGGSREPGPGESPARAAPAEPRGTDGDGDGGPPS